MKIFENESSMQQWISEQFAMGKSLADFVTNFDDFEHSLSNNQSFSLRKVIDSFRFCLFSFDNNEVIVENRDISLSDQDILKPDFLVYAPTTQSVIIIELKNLKGPTREVGTEIGAYAAEVKTHLPFLADGDVINVVIASHWPTLLRHYVFNDIVWMDRKLICLQPINTKAGIQLEIISPDLIADTSPEIKFNTQELGGYHLCLYDEGLYGGADYFRMENNENQMRCALAVMAAKGNSLKTHGFAFLWRHAFEVGLAPYVITMVNLSPFQALPRLLQNSKIALNDITKRLLRILMDHDPNGHGHLLDSICDEGIRFLERFSKPIPENYTDWNTLKTRIFENTDAIAFVGWGIFEELFFDRLHQEYQNGEFDHSHTDPLVAISMLNEIIGSETLYANWEMLGFNQEDDNEGF